MRAYHILLETDPRELATRFTCSVGRNGQREVVTRHLVPQDPDGWSAARLAHRFVRRDARAHGLDPDDRHAISIEVERADGL